MTEPFNPYAVSEVNLEPGLSPEARVPANATQRLLATLIDWVFYGSFSAVSLIAVSLMGALRGDYEIVDPALVLATGLTGLAFLVNLALMARRGQTVGKLLIGVRVADMKTGQVPSFLRVLLLRVLPLWVLSCFSPILIGVELVMLYLKDGRTICDYMAGTQVVRGHPPEVI